MYSVYLMRYSFLVLLSIAAISGGIVRAQEKQRPTPSPTPASRDADQEPVRVYTEEVRLPVVAFDAYGHYDPTLAADDVLVLEDGVAQQVRSVRHISPNVLLLLDTGGESSGLGGVSKSTSLTRQVASEIVNRLRDNSYIEVIQSGSSVNVIQPWTTDKAAVLKTLQTKLLSTKRSRISDAIVTATRELKNRPEGSRHVVLVTDGVDTSNGNADRAEAMRRLIAARATVHVISYTEFVRQDSDKKTSGISGGQRPTASDPITATDPTLPPGTTRSPTYGVSIRFDPAMRRRRKAYEAEVARSQQVLTSVAEETGGKILLPTSRDQMLAQATDVARAIGAEYVVTYRPKRPLADARPGEYRRVEVSSRRVGLTLHSRRGYVVPTQNE